MATRQRLSGPKRLSGSKAYVEGLLVSELVSHVTWPAETLRLEGLCGLKACSGHVRAMLSRQLCDDWRGFSLSGDSDVPARQHLSGPQRLSGSKACSCLSYAQQKDVRR